MARLSKEVLQLRREKVALVLARAAEKLIRSRRLIVASKSRLKTGKRRHVVSA